MPPLVFRPRRALLTATALSALLVGAAALGWVALPAAVQAQFTGPQLLTLAFFVVVMVGFMMSLGLSYVRADAAGITFRNGLRTHRVAWTEIRGFRFTENDPWAYVLLEGDPEQRPLLGIQRTDHARAEAAVAALRAARDEPEEGR